MHIGFLLSEFKIKGGIERMALNMAGGLSERGHRCSLFFPALESAPLPYPVPQSVCVGELPPTPITNSWLEKATETLGDAHLDVLFFMSNGSVFGRFLPTICQSLSVALVWSERSSPEVQQMYWNSRERQACMALADAIHMLTRRSIDILPSFLQARALAIPNFSALAALPSTSSSTSNRKKRLLVVARLSVEKQIPVLLHAFTHLKEFFNSWECRICGDGPKRKEYEELIQKLNLQNHVILLGAVENIAEEYAAADVFCLPSRNESFGLALVEAQGFGLPGVGFGGCPGVNEIILHGENGLLAPEMTAESLAHALRCLMVDDNMRLRMRTRARELYVRYEREHVLDQWERLFIDAQSKARRNILEKMDDFIDPILQTTLRDLLDKPLQMDREDWKKVFVKARSLIKHGTPAKKKQ